MRGIISTDMIWEKSVLEEGVSHSKPQARCGRYPQGKQDRLFWCYVPLSSYLNILMNTDYP